MKREGTILGIDPGTRFLGYGIIRVSGGRMEYVGMGVVKMTSIADPYRRMSHILEKMYELLDTYRPDSMAIEAPFYSKNVQSMLKLGRAQGVAIAAALSRNVPVCEYAPRKVKMAVTGRGAASKDQVATMVKTILNVTEEPVSQDATDALAVAVCHAQQPLLSDKTPASSGSWEAYVKNNPRKVVQK
ncbi:MAG TPA: crossover junction endodeoxyribonuclease RuvC [Bacteroidales bacterium]|jgi:crossover junction endodeoxyribonuclease RuvC|nr:crossover junction endodeoxyribonuclease RuvC [Bacteroidales bacterium]